MVVATILGGMGNQLRAYATAYTVASYLEQPLILDVSDYFGGYFRPYVLDLLSIPDHLKIYYPQKIPKYCGPFGAPAQFLEGFDGIINTNTINNREELLAAVEGKQNIWLMGYGKISFCTGEETEELKKLFQPVRKSRFLQEFIDRAECGESVAVHIRRTDFIDMNWAGDETLEYYQAAINYLRQEVHEPKFYFFSDDIEWVKKALGYSADYHYIDCFGGREADLEELFCMAACRHHVLTDRSTFGAWAAFLSWRKKGVNIANGVLDLDGIPGIFVMDRRMVERYCGDYDADYRTQEKVILWDELEGMLETNDNAGVIDYIDKLSLDAYGILPEMRERLMELKGIAHIQNSDVETALSVFDSLQQIQRDDFDFSFNYSIALDMAGRRMEGLLYLDNALRINADAVSGELVEIEDEREILRLIKEQKKRHYILLTPPYGYSRNVKGYHESIAIMLRNMGNTVTIVEIGDTLTMDDTEWSQNNEIAILYWMLNTAERQDRVYNWDIDQYQAYPVEMSDGKKITVSDFLSCLAEEKGEDVILLTHSIEGIRNASEDYPLIFFDVISEWDARKNALREYAEAQWDEIYRYADKVITEKELPHQWSDKKVSPFELGKETNRIGAEEIIFREDRIITLEHYMRNEESLCGMLSVLKAVEELGNHRG